MQVKQEIYYHIQKIDEWSGPWMINSVIYWGQKERNNFNKFYDNYSFITNLTNGKGPMHGKTALENFLKQPEEFQLYNYRDMLEEALSIIKEQSMFIRETIFEEVRANYFPELPSRKTCIWVCTENAVPYWWNNLRGHKRIYKLLLTGILHKADPKHLINDTLSHNEIRSNAFNYWTGSDGYSPLEEELLFEGVIKVLEEYKDVEDFERSHY